jgi:hypothetical protein
MIKVKNPNQLNIFDPWDFLTPKRRQMLDAGWPILFREHILPSIPVNEVSKHFNATFGRPTKELYSMLKMGSSLPLTLINAVLYFSYLSFNFSIIFFKPRNSS